MTFVRLMAVLTIALVVSARCAEAAPLRIMAIGDSITHGVDGATATADASKGGYRPFLANMLQGAHIDHVWQGAWTDGPPNAMRHEGWNGETIRQIDLNRLDPALDRYATDLPDVVLLMIGTNDAWHPDNGDPLTSRERMLPNLRNLLVHIHDRAPNARIVVSTICPLGFPFPEAEQARLVYNAGLYDVASELQGLGVNMGVVNAGGRVPGNTNWFPDGVHPGQPGYQLIAQGFYEAFMLPATPEPATGVLMLAVMIPLLRARRSRV